MPIMNTGALLALVDGFAPAGTPDMGMVADPLTSHAEAGPEEVVSSLGSQPEGGRAFVRHTPQTRRTLRETPRRPLASSIRAICARHLVRRWMAAGVRWNSLASSPIRDDALPHGGVPLRRMDRQALPHLVARAIRTGGARSDGGLPRRAVRRRPGARAGHRYGPHRPATQPAGRSRTRDRTLTRNGHAAAGPAGRVKHRGDHWGLRDDEGGRCLHARLPPAQHDHEPDDTRRTGRGLPQRRRTPAARRLLRHRELHPRAATAALW